MGHEYGWAKSDILNNIYFDELYYLTRQINLRKLNEYRMLVAISSNPHTKNPRELWQTFERMERKIQGRDYIDDGFDAVGFERFKQMLKNKSAGFIVK